MDQRATVWALLPLVVGLGVAAAQAQAQGSYYGQAPAAAKQAIGSGGAAPLAPGAPTSPSPPSTARGQGPGDPPTWVSGCPLLSAAQAERIRRGDRVRISAAGCVMEFN